MKNCREREEVWASETGKHKRKPKFGKVDEFWRNFIRETIYSFKRKNHAPTVHVIYKELKEISAGKSYESPYRRTTLYHLLKRLSFEHRKTDNRQVIMETFQIIVWRWEYFWKIQARKLCNFVLRWIIVWFSLYHKNGLVR